MRLVELDEFAAADVSPRSAAGVHRGGVDRGHVAHVDHLHAAVESGRRPPLTIAPHPCSVTPLRGSEPGTDDARRVSDDHGGAGVLECAGDAVGGRFGAAVRAAARRRRTVRSDDGVG